MTRVLVNGEERLLTGALDLASLVGAVLAAPAGPAPVCAVPGGRADAPTGVAAAVNDRVVPRSTWADVVLRDDDRVEIVSAVQGG